MGQSASSINHTENVHSNNTNIDRTRNEANNTSGRPSRPTMQGAESSRSQRRRRSLSPENDTPDLSRSGRLRRRLSKLVPSAISNGSTSSAERTTILEHALRENAEGEGEQAPSSNVETLRTGTASPSDSRFSPRLPGQRAFSRVASHIRGSSTSSTSTRTQNSRPLSMLPSLPRSMSSPAQRPLSMTAFRPDSPSPLRPSNTHASPSPSRELNLSDLDTWSTDRNRSATPSSNEISARNPTHRGSRLAHRRSTTIGSSLYDSFPATESRPLQPFRNLDDGDDDISRLARPSLYSRMRSRSPSHLRTRERESDVSAVRNSSGSVGGHLADFGSSLSDLGEHESSDNPTRARPGEDQAAVLSRLLSVAAAATAASLVGNSDQAISQAQDVAGDSVDGSFESFLRALQNGRLAAALRNGGNELGGPTSEDDQNEPGSGQGNIAPLNFFRMFRFGQTTASSTDSTNQTGQPTERMVPVIIVGIRSVNPHDNMTRDGRPTPPFFDALANLPATMPGGSNSPPLSPRPNILRRTRSARDSPLASPTSHHMRSNTNETRLPSLSSLLPETWPTESTIPRSNMSSTSSSPLPRRRPTLPSPILSSSSSRTRRRSRLSGDPLADGYSPFMPGEPAPALSRAHTDSPLSVLDDFEQTLDRITNLEESSRRRSAQRNVDRDQGSSSRGRAGSRSPSEGTRSWIIYVLGGSYPENHPILTTPSLFTDTPTYEDMMLLSSLLGPAKPPVASQEDVESAGGLYVVITDDKENDRPPLDDALDYVRVNAGDRCLVCLSDFERAEKCRRLAKCEHLFHKECIDEWLTTGRNSCPLCRAQGVTETPVKDDTTPNSPIENPAPLVAS